MTSPKAGGDCLVARAVPCSDDSDKLCETLEKLTVEDETNQKVNKVTHNISPSDFLTLQSIRSSALAKKTNTTSKFSRGGPSLFNDLQNKEKLAELNAKAKENADEKKEKENNNDEEKEKKKDCDDKDEKVAKKDDDAKTEEDEADDDLCSRGPVMREKQPRQQAHPYYECHHGTAAQTPVQDYSSFSNYGAGYECGGNSWSDSPETYGSSSPDTVISDQGYSSNSPTFTSPPQSSPFIDQSISTDELTRLLDEPPELPDILSDFILRYSRRYAGAHKEDSSLSRPPSADSGVDSPMSARTAHASPEVPLGGQSGPTTPQNTANLSPRHIVERLAKQRLRAIIPDQDAEIAWAWALKSFMAAPGALCYQDEDRDTLLHIVTQHMDLAKIFAITEHQLKMDVQVQRAFDLPNKNNETPMYLAVLHRAPAVVAYFLELGANPNVRSMRHEKDTALHYAAARGMTEIVEMLCKSRGVNVNMANGRGQTPLIAAVKNHGLFDQGTQKVVDNTAVLRALLAAGADPSIVDSSNGKTVIHYAVETMNPAFVEIIGQHVDDECQIMNQTDYNNEAPMETLKSYSDATLQQAMCLSLITNGALLMSKRE